MLPRTRRMTAATAPGTTAVTTRTGVPSRVMSPNLIREAKLPYSQHLAKDLEFLSKNIDDLHNSIANLIDDLHNSIANLSAKANTVAGSSGADGSSLKDAEWKNFQPTVTGSGSMSVMLVENTASRYLRLGPIVFFALSLLVNVGAGGPSTDLILSLPVGFVGGDSCSLYGDVIPPGEQQQNVLGEIGSGGFVIRLNALKNWPSGQSRIRIQGFYQCA